MCKVPPHGGEVQGAEGTQRQGDEGRGGEVQGTKGTKRQGEEGRGISKNKV